MSDIQSHRATIHAVCRAVAKTAICGSLIASTARAQRLPADSARADSSIGKLVYPGVTYGSASVISPVTMLFNKGFDHFQARNTSRNLPRFQFGAIRYASIDALLHPVAAIERHPGWRAWLRGEILPLTFNSTDAGWPVNYAEHLLVGGMTYRTLGEWYAARDFPLPKLWAAATTFGAGMLNEAAEFQTSREAASSSVADLYVFDLGGILLMNWDRPVRFVAGTLQGADWSNLATVTLPRGDLLNNGQYYVVKIPLPTTETRLFLRTGMGIQAGLSRHVNAAHTLSIALGADTEVRRVDETTLGESIRLKIGGGVYFDRNNSLLASLVAGPTVNRVLLNVFPGVAPGILSDLGFWGAYTRDGRITFGVVHRRALGLGIGYGG